MRLAGPRHLMDRRKADLAHQPADALASDRPSKAAKMANHLARAVERAFQKRLIDKPHEDERSALRRPASDRTWRARLPPVRTGGQSRAVDDLDRSCSSSDQGSAIEGFRQKIPLDDKLSDLGVQLRHFRVPEGGGFESLVVEHLGQLLDRLTLPLRDQIGMQLMSLPSSATVRWPCMASSATLALNSAVKRLRVFLSDRPSRRRTHSSSLYRDRRSQSSFSMQGRNHAPRPPRRQLRAAVASSICSAVYLPTGFSR